jgi:hypothetical protein
MTRGDDEEGDAALTFLHDHRAWIVVSAVRDALEPLQLGGPQITEQLGAGQASGCIS